MIALDMVLLLLLKGIDDPIKQTAATPLSQLSPVSLLQFGWVFSSRFRTQM